MNRSDLIDEMASKFGQLSRTDIELAIDTLMSAMAGALARGSRIEIRGFGSFSVNRQAAKLGRNPRTGQSVSIPARRVIHFKPGKDLRANVNNHSAD
jgi:integration host factor subunit beta